MPLQAGPAVVGPTTIQLSAKNKDVKLDRSWIPFCSAPRTYSVSGSGKSFPYIGSEGRLGLALVTPGFSGKVSNMGYALDVNRTCTLDVDFNP